MEALKLEKVIEVMGGQWVPLGADASDISAVSVSSVSTDSRSLSTSPDGGGDVANDTLFVTLSGDRFDAHEFLPEIASRVRAAVVSETRLDRVRAAVANARDGMSAIVVPDPLEALARLAAWYRTRLPAAVIGITGSVGKTTVKEFLGQLLSRSYPTVRAEKSFNNLIGLSLTLLKADRQPRFLVAELGTSAPGEISQLTRMAAPDFAVVTCVAAAHLEGLGDLDGVAREKSSIFEGLQPGGVALIPVPIHGEELFLDQAQERAGHVLRVGWFLEGNCPPGYWITGCGRNVDRPGFRFEINRRHVFDLPHPGRHNVFNAVVAAAVAHECGVDWEDLQQAVAELRLPPLRLQLSKAGGVTIVDDTYNANPMSVRGALEAVRDMHLPDGGRWHLVLGDLLELGDDASSFHRHLGEEIAESSVFARMWTVGKESRHAAESATVHGLEADAVSVSESDRLMRDLCQELRPGDGVLFKASRGLALDVVARGLREALGDDNEDATKTEKGGPGSSHAVLSL